MTLKNDIQRSDAKLLELKKQSKYGYIQPIYILKMVISKGADFSIEENIKILFLLR